MSLTINTSTLNSYVLGSQVPLSELRAKIKHLDKFMSGEKQPTFNQLSEIAKKINVPTGLLLLDRKIDTKSVKLEFRTLNSNGILSSMSEELKDTIREMQEKQEFLRNEIDDELDFIGKFSIDDDIFSTADAIREKLAIPMFFQKECRNQPIPYFRDKVNQLGVFVFFNGKVKSNTHRPLNLNEFRGFALLDKKAPIIFINQKDGKNGQLFTLVHELVHLFIGENSIFNIIDAGEYQFDRTETFVNKVTAELLTPRQIFLEMLKKNNDTKILASIFKVSEFVIFRRLLDLKFISKDEYKEHIKTLEAELRKISFHTPNEEKKSNGNYYQNIKFM
ncbi:ImmA/IrrE family metallo-endopeptidase [Moraxella catarrhalis]|nr:ImmA/IrrE family metallo-endopeptidase [Moraxella catarrhalis]RKM51389.1 ImmA/IrrE family metallo-endopeptidase [Moraxella catarrhalis]